MSLRMQASIMRASLMLMYAKVRAVHAVRSSCYIHDVFHVSLLEKYITRPGENNTMHPGALTIEGDVPVFEVELF